MSLTPIILIAIIAALPGCDRAGPSKPDLVWGIYGSKEGWLKKPRVAAIDSEDHIYMCDLTDRIQVFDRDGKFIRCWRTPALNVDGPSGLTIDRFNRLLVADTHFYRILVYDLTGKLLFQVGDGIQGTTPGRFGYPTDVVIDSSGNFYVSEYGENDRIQVFSPKGEWLRQWGGHGFEPGQMRRPRAMAMDDQEQIYVADSCNHRIQIFDLQGNVMGIWGREGEAPGELSYPYDLAFDADGALYVCEYGNSRVQKFTKDGKLLGTWGGPGRKHGELNNPWALTVDSQGYVSVIDSNNHRVQRFRM